MTDSRGGQRVHTFCALCIARCGAVAIVEDGRFTRLEPDPVASDRAGAVRQGSRRAGARLPARAADPPAAPHPAEGRSRSRLGADRLGRGARPDRRRDAPDCRAAWAGGGRASACPRRPPPRSPIPSGFIRRLMNAFGTPNAVISTRCLRLGPRLRHPLHLWRRQRRHQRAAGRCRTSPTAAV